MSVHSPAALARNGACSIQTISSRSLARPVIARSRLTRLAKRARFIPELYPGRTAQQQMAAIEIAFAGIFQPFARPRWIRFGLLVRDHKFSRRLSIPQIANRIAPSM
jgi:hypothetical protein